MTDYPKQLAGARRCGAKTRGARGGRPCRSPAMANGRCRMHGGRSPGAPPGERHPNFKTGRYSHEAKALSKWARDLARDIDVETAKLMAAGGVRPLKAIRRKAHVKRALRAMAKASKGEQPK